MIGEYIRQLRKQKRISQRELAELSGISHAEISRIESGERKEISPFILQSLAPHLGVHYLELYFIFGYIKEEDYKKIMLLQHK